MWPDSGLYLLSMTQSNDRLDESDFVWNDSDDPDGLFHNRRAMLRLGITTLIAVGLVLMISSFFVGGAMADGDFVANDIEEIETQNGMLDELTIAPEGDIWWEGLEKEPAEIELAVSAAVDDSQHVHTETITDGVEGLAGETSFEMDTMDLFEETNIGANDFRPGQGDTKTTTVTIELQVTILDEDGETLVAFDASDDFDVTVYNKHPGGGVGGQANTDAA